MEEQKKNPAQGLSESEQVQVRRQKLADLQAAGHDPFTLTKYPQDAYRRSSWIMKSSKLVSVQLSTSVSMVCTQS